MISPTEDDEQEDSGVAAPPSAPISYASMPSVAMTTDELGSGSSGGVGGGPKGQGSRPAVTRKTPTPSSLGVRSSVQSPRPRSAPRPTSAASKSVDHPTPSRGAGAGTAKPGAVNRGQGQFYARFDVDIIKLTSEMPIAQCHKSQLVSLIIKTNFTFPFSVNENKTRFIKK